MIIFWVIALVFICFGFVVITGAPYVPTLKNDLRVAFDELYPITAKDTVLDVGSGDGKVLREVARRGGNAIGYEINPLLVAMSWILNRRYPSATVQLKNFWLAPIPPETTLVYAFTVSRDIKRLARKLEAEANRLDKSLTLLSYGAIIPGIEPDKQAGAHHIYTFTPLHAQKPQV